MIVTKIIAKLERIWDIFQNSGHLGIFETSILRSRMNQSLQILNETS
jgi:hypothetical protein